LPVPKAIVLAFELSVINLEVVHVLLLSVTVPVVRVVVPENVGEPDNDRLMSDLLIVQAAHTAVAVTSTTAAAPLLVSKTTVSPLVGTAAPPAPPDEADQFAVLALFQVPEPPTQ
jgi:hypothetical protein